MCAVCRANPEISEPSREEELDAGTQEAACVSCRVFYCVVVLVCVLVVHKKMLMECIHFFYLFC